MEKVKAKVIDEQEGIKNEVLERLRLEKLITKVMKGKKCIYQNGLGREINTFTEELSFNIAVNLEPLEMYLNIPQESETDEVRIIAKALFERAKEKIEEAVDYIEKNYGMIEIERASYHQEGIIKPEKILGVVFTPCDSK